MNKVAQKSAPANTKGSQAGSDLFGDAGVSVTKRDSVPRKIFNGITFVAGSPGLIASSIYYAAEDWITARKKKTDTPSQKEPPQADPLAEAIDRQLLDLKKQNNDYHPTEPEKKSIDEQLAELGPLVDDYIENYTPHTESLGKGNTNKDIIHL